MRIVWKCLLAIIVAITWASAVTAAPVFVCERPDGRVTIIAPAPKAQRGGESDAAFLDRMLQRTKEANPQMRDWPCSQVERGDLPTDRSRRNAWRLRGGKIVETDVVPAAPGEMSKPPGSSR